METRIFIKFGKKEHIEALQKQGLFYCKDIKYFNSLEDGQIRGDEFETIIELRYSENAIIELRDPDDANAEWVKLQAKNLLFKKYADYPLGNLYCMSALKVNANKKPTLYVIDERFKQFGSHFLIVYQHDLFIERIRKALDASGFKYKGELVEYLDLRKHIGEKTLFHKPIEYSWQEEFRIHINSNLAEPFEFSIGSIEDISEVYDFSKVSSFLFRLPGRNPNELKS